MSNSAKNLFWLFLLILLSVSQASFSLTPVDPAPSGYDVYNNNIAHGILTTVQYSSKTVGTTRKVEVYTPPGYSKNKKYPVLYLLHGIGGDHNEWKYYSNPDFILDNLYAQNKLVPMIVVFPNGRAMTDDRTPSNLFSNENINAFANFEYDLINDLIPFIDTNYPVLAGAENRALAGYSMGGGQALNFGLGHMDKFAWIGGFSVGPNVKPASQLVPNPSDTNNKLKLLWLSCGDQDGLINSNRDIHNYFTNNNVNHIWFVVSGAHETKVWQNDLYNFSQLVFKSTVISLIDNRYTNKLNFSYNHVTNSIKFDTSSSVKNIGINDLNGRLIKSARNTQNNFISTQGIKSGIYIVQLAEGDKLSSGKFLIE